MLWMPNIRWITLKSISIIPTLYSAWYLFSPFCSHLSPIRAEKGETKVSINVTDIDLPNIANVKAWHCLNEVMEYKTLTNWTWWFQCREGCVQIFCSSWAEPRTLILGSLEPSRLKLIFLKLSLYFKKCRTWSWIKI